MVSFVVRHQPDDADAVARALDAAASWLHWVDDTFSTYKFGSEISRLGRRELTLRDCHPEVRAILGLCDELARATGGYFDVRAAGRLDPSGVVKGWSIERASELLAENGWSEHLVEAGGDVRLRGLPPTGTPWQVGITHPLRLDAYCAVLSLVDGAVATSGTYERGFHVFDPYRGAPVTDLAAVTVVGPTLTLADAYATAALAMGPKAVGWVTGLAGYEALVIDADGRAMETPGFDGYRFRGSQPSLSGALAAAET